MSPPAPKPHSYAFANVSGLSRSALDLHLSLYHGYVREVALLQQHAAALAGEDAFAETVRLRTSGVAHRLAFELNGLVLHELFFEQLDGQPSEADSIPAGVLLQAMNKSFTDVSRWRSQVIHLAQTRGIGWVMTALNPCSRQLQNFWIADHQLGVPVGLHPIAVFDLWEHAYLPDHATGNREDYMATLFHNLDWSVLQRRMESHCQDAIAVGGNLRE